MARTRWRLAWFLCLVTLAWMAAGVFLGVGAKAAPAAVAPDQRTYLEFVFDSSSSMNERAEGRQSRMDVAKSVLNEVIQGLPERPDLEIALRVYGAQIKQGGCNDSVLVQDFLPVGNARRKIADTVRALTPRGLTPIAYSLEQAAKDFPVRKGPRNIIILITDGEESCGGQPCKVSKRLQDEGFILEPYVVGFAVTDAQAASLRCIGQYYEARDAASLRVALSSIMAKAIQPTTISVEAWGGGRNVLDQALIELRSEDGRVMPGLRATAGAVTLPVKVDPGIYTVRGRLTILSQDIFAESARLQVDEGSQANVRLDFGDLTGQALLTVRGGERDLSNAVNIRLTRDGLPVTADWRGVPLAATLTAGVYEVEVSLRDRPAVSRKAPLILPPGTVTPLTMDLGDMPGTLVVTVTAGGRDVTRQCELALYRNDSRELGWGTGFDTFRYEGQPGTYRLDLKYRGETLIDKQVTGVRVRALEETRVNVNLDEGLGSLEVKVVGNGRDITAAAEVRTQGQVRSLDLPLAGEVRRSPLPPGVYSIQATYKGLKSAVARVEVAAGQTARATLELDIPGRIAIVPRLDQGPLSPDALDVQVFSGDRATGAPEKDGDRFVISVPPGSYRVIGRYTGGNGQVREAEAFVEAEQTSEVVLTFSAAGKVLFRGTLDGKPLKGASVSLYVEGGEFHSYLQDVEPGTWELAAEDGIYELRVNPNIPGYEERVFPGITVQTGETVERNWDLSKGKVRFTASLNGKPLKGASVSLYSEEGEFVAYLDDVEPGLWELSPAEGTYELRVGPNVPGYEERNFPGIVIRNGEVVEKSMVLGQGVVRFRATLNGKPLRGAGVSLYNLEGEFVSYLHDVEPGLWELSAAEGTYELRVAPNVPGYEERNFPGIVIRADQPVEKSMVLGQGVVRFRATLNGKPLKGAGVSLYNLEGEFVSYLHDVEPGLWELSAAEGTYELRVAPNVPGYEECNFPGIVIRADQPVEKSVALGQGKVRFKGTLNGQPLKGAAVSVYNEEGRFVSYLQKTDEPGVWELNAAEGTYELRVNPNVPGYEERRFRGVVLKADQPAEVSAAFGQGKIRFRGTSNGQPLKERDVRVFVNDEEGHFVSYLRVVEPGLWEISVAEGLYELRVGSDLPGFAERKFKDIRIASGETVERTLAFGQGKVRFRGTVNGQPLKEKGVRVFINDEEGHFVSYLRALEPGLWEVSASEGVYELRIGFDLPGFKERKFADIAVAAGQAVEKSLAFGQGKISVKVSLNGAPLEKATVSILQDDRFVSYVKATSPGVYVIDVAEGIYDVDVRPGVKDLPQRRVRDLEVKAGATAQAETSYTQ